MNNLRFNILFKFSIKPTGGGNQFLTQLREDFRNDLVYSGPIKSNVFIINSHHFGKGGLFIIYLFFLSLFKKIIIIHRLDGLLSVGRGDKSFLKIDKTIFYFSLNIANGVVFQSNWAKNEFKKLLEFKNLKSKIIYNDPNKIFKLKKSKKKYSIKNRKINLVYSSWSNNIKKGFDTLKILDKNLNFKNFNFYFIGNLPHKISYKNISVLAPMNIHELANFYQKMDVFIAPMRDDACSNALIEAVHSGLFIVALDSGANKEIIGQNSELFNSEENMINFLNSREFKTKLTSEFSFKFDRNASKKYKDFAEELYREKGKEFKTLYFIICFYKNFLNKLSQLFK